MRTELVDGLLADTLPFSHDSLQELPMSSYFDNPTVLHGSTNIIRKLRIDRNACNYLKNTRRTSTFRAWRTVAFSKQ